MTIKKSILPLASALAALSTNAVSSNDAVAAANPETNNAEAASIKNALAPTANTFVSTGETLLGFVVSEQPDGTIVAQHSSHASHASHHSHYSGR